MLIDRTTHSLDGEEGKLTIVDKPSQVTLHWPQRAVEEEVGSNLIPLPRCLHF